MPNGIAISQSGVPIDGAPDYTKVIDSRDKFLEVYKQDTVIINLPAIASGGSSANGFEQQILVVNHGLGFYPLFEQSASITYGTALGSQSDGVVLPFKIYSDKENLYLFPVYQASTGQAAVTVTIKYRIYNLDISQSYQATASTNTTSSIGNSNIGVKILDGSSLSNVGDSSPVGFAIDTTKKVLSIHMVTTQHIDNITPTVSHTVGYPPTYYICPSPTTVFSSFFSGFTILARNLVFSGPMFEPVARITATNNTLQFIGIQSVFSGTFCIVILKDPVGMPV